MIREVDLVDYYLPPFMQKYKEPVAALKAEEPEFQLIWKAADRVLYNHFISTADEYGISRFEKLLGIFPSSEDTLESRRERVQSRWFKSIPYTLKTLINKLVTLCGDRDFTIKADFSESYTMILNVSLSIFGQVDELNEVLSYMTPQNIVVKVNNTLNYEQSASIFEAGATVESKLFTITSQTEKEHELTGYVHSGSVVTTTIQRTIN